MNKDTTAEYSAILKDGVLKSLKEKFIGKDEVIDLMGVALVAGENLFLFGPPGTAKSSLVHELGRMIDGRTFDYLLTRFTEPNELFGPFDIRKLREGELLTNTEGMLPEASLVFLDELLNANSAILNTLLNILNEKIFRRGKEVRSLPLLMTIAASNHLPDDDALRALFDRFLLRVHCDYVDAGSLDRVLEAGWRMEASVNEKNAVMSVEKIRFLQGQLQYINLGKMLPAYMDLIHKLRQAGVAFSDRRAVKLQKVIAASALLCGRTEAHSADLWVLRYIWDTDEQREVVTGLVDNAIGKFDEQLKEHPAARRKTAPDPEELAADLQDIGKRLGEDGLSAAEMNRLKDRLSHLAQRLEWLDDALQRSYLKEECRSLWKRFEVGTAE